MCWEDAIFHVTHVSQQDPRHLTNSPLGSRIHKNFLLVHQVEGSTVPFRRPMGSMAPIYRPLGNRIHGTCSTTNLVVGSMMTLICHPNRKQYLQHLRLCWPFGLVRYTLSFRLPMGSMAPFPRPITQQDPRYLSAGPWDPLHLYPGPLGNRIHSTFPPAIGIHGTYPPTHCVIGSTEPFRWPLYPGPLGSRIHGTYSTFPPAHWIHDIYTLHCKGRAGENPI